MAIVLPNLRSLKHEKERKTKIVTTRWNVKPKFPQQTTFGTLFMEIANKRRVLLSFSMKTAEMCFSKTCVNFGRCYGNQGGAEEVEK